MILSHWENIGTAGKGSCSLDGLEELHCIALRWLYCGLALAFLGSRRGVSTALLLYCSIPSMVLLSRFAVGTKRVVLSLNLLKVELFESGEKEMKRDD